MESFGHSLDSLEGIECCLTSQLNPKPVLVLKRLSEQQIQRYDKHFFEKYVQKEVEKNNEDIIESDFMRCLGLISTKHLDSSPIESLKQSFPLRSIARIGHLSTDGHNRLLLDKNLIEKQNFRPIVRRVKRNTQTIHKKSILLSKEEIEKQKQLEVKKGLQKRLREETNDKKKIVSFVTQFEITSQLFDRLVRIFDTILLNANKVYKRFNKSIVIPDYDDNKKLLKSESVVKYNRWMSSNIERRAMKSELAFTLKGDNHKFTFTRRQRIDKMKRLSRGLNWKSRLRSFKCRQTFIRLSPINKCPVCLESVVDSHSCPQFPPTKDQPLIASYLNEDNDHNIETNGCTSLDLKHLITESIVTDLPHKDLENHFKETNYLNENKEIVGNNRRIEDKDHNSHNMKRAFVEIDFNFDTNSVPKVVTKRKSKRFRQTLQ